MIFFVVFYFQRMRSDEIDLESEFNQGIQFVFLLLRLEPVLMWSCVPHRFFMIPKSSCFIDKVGQFKRIQKVNCRITMDIFEKCHI